MIRAFDLLLILIAGPLALLMALAKWDLDPLVVWWQALREFLPRGLTTKPSPRRWSPPAISVVVTASCLYPTWTGTGLAVSAVKCKGCGLVFLNPRMTADAYREFYEAGHYRDLVSAFYSKWRKTDHSLDPMENYQRSYALKVLKHLKGFGPYSGKLLDVGGSTGVRGGTGVQVLQPGAYGARALGNGSGQG